MDFLGIESLFRGSNEVAYEDAVEDVSEVPVIFIDPDLFKNALKSVGIDYSSLDTVDAVEEAFDNLSSEEETRLSEAMAKALEEHLENELPGSTKALLDDLSKKLGEEISTEELAALMFAGGPRAFDGVTVDDKKYGFVVLPAEFLDTKDKVVDAFLRGEYSDDVLESIKKNMPGSNGEWGKVIGYHEGKHLDGFDQASSNVAVLEGEVRADRRAIKEMIADGDADVALAFKDLRALSDNDDDTTHATSALLNSEDQASTLHLEIAATYKDSMFFGVDDTFDWESYEGEATDAEGLLKENPDTFFKAVNKGLDELRTEVMADYDKDPTSYEAIGGVVGTQIFTDYIKDFEGAYRRRALGQSDFPDNQPTQLIPQSVEDEFYEDLKHENAIQAVAEKHGDEVNSEYSADDAYKGFDWEGYEGEAKSAVDYLADTDLRRENPEIFYSTQREHLANMKTDVQAQYAADPSRENLGKMLAVEHIIEREAPLLNLRLSNVADAPELPLEHFVPADLRHDYYEEELAIEEAQLAAKATEEAEARAAADATDATDENKAPELDGSEYNGGERLLNIEPSKGYEQGVDGTAYTTEVIMQDAGEPKVDFENGVSVGGLSITHFFAQNVEPPPEDVMLVNAITPDVADTLDAPMTSPTVETGNTAQTLQ